MNRVLYIAGYGRSGSTVLDTVLGNHPKILGAGEAYRFFTDVADGGACTCGEVYESCKLWGKVLLDLDDQLDDVDPAELAPALAAFDSGSSKNRRNDDPDERARYGNVWGTLFRSAFAHSGAEVIVDSSKTSRGSRRIVQLAGEAGLEVVVLHLVRDPRAVLFSAWYRGNNDKLEAQDGTSRSTLGMFRPLVGWLMANFAVTRSKRALKDLPVLRVRYEDFVSDPDRALASIGDFVGLDLQPVADALNTGDEMEAGHGIRGNRMRRAGPIRLRLDTEWVTESPGSARWLGKLYAPIAMAYGYSTLRWPARISAESSPSSST